MSKKEKRPPFEGYGFSPNPEKSTHHEDEKVQRYINNWRWTPQQYEAANLIADNHFKLEDVADKIGIAKRTLDYWIQVPRFRQYVDSRREAMRIDLERITITNKKKRLQILDKDFRRTDKIIEGRISDYAQKGELHSDFGEGSGFLVRDLKGRDATQPVYTTDNALMRERRATLEQAAREMGEWTEKQEITGKDGGAIVVQRAAMLSELLSPEELESIEKRLLLAAANDPVPEAAIELSPDEWTEETLVPPKIFEK